MRKVLTITLLAMAVVATAGAAQADARKSYFIETHHKPTNLRVSMFVNGQTLKKGYFFQKWHCKGHPKVKTNFIDFGNTRIQRRRFHDVDGGGWFRDSLVGELVSKKKVRGSVHSYADFNDDGPICRTRARFTLERVDRARWRRYSRTDRKIDKTFPGDHREAPRRR